MISEVRKSVKLKGQLLWNRQNDSNNTFRFNAKSPKVWYLQSRPINNMRAPILWRNGVQNTLILCQRYVYTRLLGGTFSANRVFYFAETLSFEFFPWVIGFFSWIVWKATQLSNLWWIPNSIRIGFGPVMKTGSSRQFKQYHPTPYMWVSSRLLFTAD